jgi:formate dehydrogenase gamma subunit
VIEEQKLYPRFRLMARIEHFVLMTSFTILAITGLPQMFSEVQLSQDFINLLGGIQSIRIIHRWAAAVLILGSVYHILTSSYRFFVKRERMAMVPDLKDLLDLRDYVLYNLGFRDEHPRMRKFNFGEKFEYWAVVWGTAVMVITGFMLLNPIATTRLLPGEIIPAALTAHGSEALLAVLAILVWHFYNVHFKHFNTSIFTGKMPENQMTEEHALEKERLDAGGRPWPELGLPTLRHRRRIYLVVASVVGIVAIGVVYWMFTFEETAITTVLPSLTPGP